MSTFRHPQNRVVSIVLRQNRCIRVSIELLLRLDATVPIVVHLSFDPLDPPHVLLFLPLVLHDQRSLKLLIVLEGCNAATLTTDLYRRKWCILWLFFWTVYNPLFSSFTYFFCLWDLQQLFLRGWPTTGHKIIFISVSRLTFCYWNGKSLRVCHQLVVTEAVMQLLDYNCFIVSSLLEWSLMAVLRFKWCFSDMVSVKVL